MDIGSLYSPSTEVHHPRSRLRPNAKEKTKTNAKTRDKTVAKSCEQSAAMPDNKGWRKKIGGKPKDLPPVKTTSDNTAAVPPLTAVSAVDSTDRRRHGWRKTITVSRPSTPMSQAPPTIALEDTDDAQSERSEASTPRRDSKPKLIRYTSLFATHKEEPVSPAFSFSEPWNADGPPILEDPWSYLDTSHVMDSIHSHMCNNYMVPIPVEFNNGLFRIFDHYRKLLRHRDLSEIREREALEHSRKVTAQWLQAEELYEAEIRRLELLIARGTNGMSGLMMARQETVVDRKRQHRKTISTDRVLPRLQRMSSKEIVREIKSRSQQVLLYRSTSPSAKMAALSQQLMTTGLPDPPLAIPAGPDRDTTLTRKVKSELNLLELRNPEPSQFFPDAGHSKSTKHVQGEVKSGVDVVKDAVECDAFVALKELGALVARRKGLDVTNFVDGLMILFGSAQTAKITEEPDIRNKDTRSPVAEEYSRVHVDDVTPRPPQRRLQSHSQQGLDQKCRRHFSFEPGDDQMRKLEVDLKAYDALSQTGSTDSESSWSGLQPFLDGYEIEGGDMISLLPSPIAEVPKPSMIPSPVQTIGRIRRENSTSSLQSVFVKNAKDDRHDSRTSIQTAFRETSSANASTKSKSRSNSNSNLRATESPLGSKERQGNLANRHSTTALAAARAAEARSSNASRSSTQLSTATTSSRNRPTSKQQRSENNDPKMSNNARKGNAE